MLQIKTRKLIKEVLMLPKIFHFGCLTTTLLFASLSPAAALPQLTGGNLDYFLMPFLGYCGIIGIARLLHFRAERRTAKD